MRITKHFWNLKFNFKGWEITTMMVKIIVRNQQKIIQPDPIHGVSQSSTELFSKQVCTGLHFIFKIIKPLRML